MKLGRISVIIPAHNEGENLVDTVGCVLENSGCADLEVVVVDDGSTDGSADRVAQRFSRDEGVVILRDAGLGVAVARNRGPGPRPAKRWFSSTATATRRPAGYPRSARRWPILRSASSGRLSRICCSARVPAAAARPGVTPASKSSGCPSGARRLMLFPCFPVGVTP